PVRAVVLGPGRHPGAFVEVRIVRLEAAERAIFDRRLLAAREKALQRRGVGLLPGRGMRPGKRAARADRHDEPEKLRPRAEMIDRTAATQLSAGGAQLRRADAFGVHGFV